MKASEVETHVCAECETAFEVRLIRQPDEITEAGLERAPHLCPFCGADLFEYDDDDDFDGTLSDLPDVED